MPDDEDEGAEHTGGGQNGAAGSVGHEESDVPQELVEEAREEAEYPADEGDEG